MVATMFGIESLGLPSNVRVFPTYLDTSWDDLGCPFSNQADYTQVQSSGAVLQLFAGEVWQVAKCNSGLVKAYKSQDDSTAKISVCRARTDLTNLKYVHVAMVWYT